MVVLSGHGDVFNRFCPDAECLIEAFSNYPVDQILSLSVRIFQAQYFGYRPMKSIYNTTENQLF